MRHSHGWVHKCAPVERMCLISQFPNCLTWLKHNYLKRGSNCAENFWGAAPSMKSLSLRAPLIYTYRAYCICVLHPVFLAMPINTESGHLDCSSPMTSLQSLKFGNKVRAEWQCASVAFSNLCQYLWYQYNMANFSNQCHLIWFAKFVKTYLLALPSHREPVPTHPWT